MSVKNTEETQWDKRYELSAVLLLALGTGLVGLDRFIISPLFPVMQADLGLDYQDLGFISGVMALTWGAASIITGPVSDRSGTKYVLVSSVLIFSILVATSGLATGLISLLIIRGVMGIAEGAFTPTAIVATVNASRHSRRGLNVGILLMMQSLVGLGLGPLIAVYLLKVLPSWHWVFAIVALPGITLGIAMAYQLRGDRNSSDPSAEHSHQGSRQFLEAFKWKQIRASMMSMCLLQASIVNLATFLPSYMTDHLHLGLTEMGWTLASLGVGGCAGMVLLPALSDKFGAKAVLEVALLIELLGLLALPYCASSLGLLFVNLTLVAGMNTGAVGLVVGPLTAAAAPRHLANTSAGMVIGVGEIIGGAVAPAVVGIAANRLGIAIIPYVATVAVALTLVGSVLFIRSGKAQAADLITRTG